MVSYTFSVLFLPVGLGRFLVRQSMLLRWLLYVQRVVPACWFGTVSCTAVNVIKVAIATGFHLFPFRTEKLSPSTPMVLRNSGRVGSRRFPWNPFFSFAGEGIAVFGGFHVHMRVPAMLPTEGHK